MWQKQVKGGKQREGWTGKRNTEHIQFCPSKLTFCTWLQAHPSLLRESVPLPLPESLLSVLLCSRSTLKVSPRLPVASCIFWRVPWAHERSSVVWLGSCVCGWGDYGMGLSVFFFLSPVPGLKVSSAWTADGEGASEEGKVQTTSSRFQ